MAIKTRQFLAPLTPLAALALQWPLWPWFQPFIWFLFYPAIFLAARLGGRRGACLATALSLVLVWFFFVPPQLSFAVDNDHVVISMAIFAVMGVLFGEAQEQLLLALARGRSAARESAAQLAAIIESSDEAIIGKSLDGVITSWNRGARKLFGYSEVEAVGQRVARLIPSGREAEENQILARIARGEGIDSFEMQRSHKDGRRIDILATISPIRDSAGQVIGASTIARDISERKRMDAELERHRLHLQELVEERTRQLAAVMQARADAEAFVLAIADNLPARVSYWDSDMRCGFVNKRFSHDHGSPREAMVGGTMLDLLDLLGPALTEEVGGRQRCALQGEEQHFERVEQHPDGTRKTFWVHHIPVVRDGQVRGVVVMGTDISEIKLAEQRLTQLNHELACAHDSAEAANRAKSAFLANMSHEIRTPMNAIIGLTQLLLRTSGDTPQRKQLAKVVDAAEHLLQIINDVLDLSKIDSGKVQLECIDFDLDALLSRTLSLVSTAAHDKGLELVLDTDHLPRALRGDPTRLSQALLNLLTNAVKFTDHGCVMLRGERIEDTADGVYVRFSVQDTGIGVPADRIGALFQPFEQGDSSTTRRYGGTGLCLAITQHLAQLMGGESGMHSQPALGSTFWFTVRLAQAQAPLPHRQPAALQGLRVLLADDIEVLVVEDNAINQEVAVSLLQMAGLVVDVAGDGGEALAMVKSKPYRLVLMDMQMPEMDGLQATREIRALDCGRDLPIVAMTANAFAEDRAACLAAGMNDHIAKPVNAQVLYAVLLRWLSPARAEGAGSPDAVDATLPAETTAAGGKAASAGSVDERLAAVAGLDARTGLRLVGGRRPAYVRITRRFASLYRDGIAGLSAALLDGDGAAARNAVHAFKGASATIGASALAEQAAVLENAILARRPAEELSSAVERLQRDLAQLVSALEAALPPVPADPPAPGGLP